MEFLNFFFYIDYEIVRLQFFHHDTLLIIYYNLILSNAQSLKPLVDQNFLHYDRLTFYKVNAV